MQAYRTTPEVFIHENRRHRSMLLCLETVQDSIGVYTVRPLAGPSGLYIQSTVIVIVILIVTVF